MTTRYTLSALGGQRSAFKLFSKAGGESTRQAAFRLTLARPNPASPFVFPAVFAPDFLLCAQITVFQSFLVRPQT
jgi:hypothetical protein